ncbi:MAG: response regulator [Bacteroidetes bacterium]|nr:response regulator [Bacteroidota bacterium]
MLSGPIIIIEDDSDDIEMIEEVLKELNIPNKTVSFQNCTDAFDYLKNKDEQPFVIFSDVNLPGLSGIDLKKQIDKDEELRKKSIPFVFFSTWADKNTIDAAYTEMTVQGFFQKGNTYGKTKDIVRAILEYWKYCKHPNT